MRLRSVVCAACGALAFAWGAMGQPAANPAQPETFKLEYKLKPGMVLIYKGSGTSRQVPPSDDCVFRGFTSILQRFVIADVDEKTGVMLVGQWRRERSSTITDLRTYYGWQSEPEPSTFASEKAAVCRLDRSGTPPIRTMKERAVRERASEFLGAILRDLTERQLDAVPLPAEPVAVGATWENAVVTDLPGIRASWKAVSTLTGIKVIDGHRCAVIESKISIDEKENAVKPTSTETEEVQTVFDVDAGFSRTLRIKSHSKTKEDDGLRDMTQQETCTLDSTSTLQAEAAAREIAQIRTIDGAIAAAYDAQYNKAVAALESLKPAELPAAWRSAIGDLEFSVIGFFTKGDVLNSKFALLGASPEPPGGEEAVKAAVQKRADLWFAAVQADTKGKWAEAVAKYKELADNDPQMAPSALIKAANIVETKLTDKGYADVLRKHGLAMQEKRASRDPMELFTLAALRADAGDPEKAAAGYRQFLAVDDPPMPANMRLLAQYRIGGLFEKQGKKAEAIEAYKAEVAMPADDDYSTKLKEQAGKRLDALAAAHP